jgi:hypothetical protein
VVNVLEQRGSWTLVEVSAKAGAAKPQQGWVFSTYLKGATIPDQSPAAPQAPAKSANQPASRPMSQPANEPVSQAATQPVNEPVSPAVAQPANEPAPANQPAN